MDSIDFAGAPVETFATIDSTMAEARRRVERGELGPVWLLAETQTEGRGRRGRAWVSPRGNLMTTFLAPVNRAPADLALIGFVAGLALSSTLQEHLAGPRIALKWPNDVFIDGAKAAGLMLDSGAGWMALGIGVNLAAAPEVDQRTTSVARACQAPAPAPREFLDSLAKRLAYWDGVLVNRGFAPLRAAWLTRAHGLGAPIRVAQGPCVLEGVFTGLSPRGELEVNTAEGAVTVAAGDILFSEAA